MRDRFLKDGLDGFLPHEVLELLLFYAVAQKDTKTEAHALINEFGSLFGVLEASEEELVRVDGIGKHTAVFLKGLLPMALQMAAFLLYHCHHVYCVYVRKRELWRVLFS